MAPAKTLCACLLLLVFVIHVVESNRLLESEKLTEEVVEGSHVNESAATIRRIDCGARCAVRCSKASRTKICKRACGTCCARCNCVPPGTYGNEDTCHCYATMTTHGGRHKCP